MLQGKVCLLCIFLLFIPSLLCAVNVHFQWGTSTGQIDGYRIYYNDIQDDLYPNQLVEVNGTTLNCTVNLNEELTYYLVVRAYNDYGESGNSNEVYWKICQSDLDNDGDVDGSDLAVFAADFGRADCPKQGDKI